MTDAAILHGRQAAVLDLLLAEVGITFDRWVVLSAVASPSLPDEVGRLVPVLSAALDAPDETVRSMLDEAEVARHVRVVSAPGGAPAGARVELTGDGDLVHERLRDAIDELTVELSAGSARRDGR